MNAIEVLKTACVSKPFKSFKNLPKGDFVVHEFERVTTDHGERIRVELAEYIVYLPERFSKALTEEVIVELNKSTVIMSFSGKDPEAGNRLLLDFDIIRTDDAGEISAASVLNEQNSG